MKIAEDQHRKLADHIEEARERRFPTNVEGDDDEEASVNAMVNATEDEPDNYHRISMDGERRVGKRAFGDDGEGQNRRVRTKGILA